MVTKKESKSNLVEMIGTTIVDYETGSPEENKDTDFVFNMITVLKHTLDYLKD